MFIKPPYRLAQRPTHSPIAAQALQTIPNAPLQHLATRNKYRGGLKTYNLIIITPKSKTTIDTDDMDRFIALITFSCILVFLIADRPTIAQEVRGFTGTNSLQCLCVVNEMGQNGTPYNCRPPHPIQQ
ncbi:hypothetical protein PCASD_06380 [Puccinia coronata f. sp. avenae]|uniref:Uncharacterized protein n=1 Tax=Puccinia coronata f. sp. avenae TaxID=200324 RepID=A0A2N5UXI7_9BASI|nr:hypothetical protein PCASD_06380 [Puccinia coronata f. sp. avenae]